VIFVTFDPPSATSHVGGVGDDVKGSGKIRIIIPLVLGQSICRTVHALYTPYMSSRIARRIGRLLHVNWMQTHSCCDFVFPADFDTRLLMVPTRMGMLTPSGHGLYMLPHEHAPLSSPPTDRRAGVNPSVALIAECNPVPWHHQFGHLHMQSRQAQHTHGVSTTPMLPSFVKKCFLRFKFAPQGHICTPQQHCLPKTSTPPNEHALRHMGPIECPVPTWTPLLLAR
jgi:hypothetical protein